MSSQWPNFRTYLIALRISHIASRGITHYSKHYQSTYALRLLHWRCFCSSRFYLSRIICSPWRQAMSLLSHQTCTQTTLLRGRELSNWSLAKHSISGVNGAASKATRLTNNKLLLPSPSYFNTWSSFQQNYHSTLLKISCFRSISGRNNYYRGLLSGGRTEKSSIVNWLPALMCKELANTGY